MANELFDDSGIDSLSISFWHKTPSVPSSTQRFFHGPFILGPMSTGSDPSAIYYTKPGELGQILFTRPSSLSTPYTGASGDGWMHVAVIMHKSGSTQVYVDGVEYEASATSIQGWDDTASGNDRFMIGAREEASPNSAYAYIGSMAHIAVFRRALTESEITTLFEAGRGVYVDVALAYLKSEVYFPFFDDEGGDYTEDINLGFGTMSSSNDLTGSPWGSSVIVQDSTQQLSGGDQYLSYLYLPFGEDSEDRPVIVDSDAVFNPAGVDNIHIVMWVNALNDSHRTLMGTSPITVTTRETTVGLKLSITDPNGTITYEPPTEVPSDNWYFISIKLSKTGAPVVKINDETVAIASGSSSGTWANVSGACMIGNAASASVPGFEGAIKNFAARRGTFSDALLTRMHRAGARVTPY